MLQGSCKVTGKSFRLLSNLIFPDRTISRSKVSALSLGTLRSPGQHFIRDNRQSLMRVATLADNDPS